MTLLSTRRILAVGRLPVLRVVRRGDRHSVHDLGVDVRLHLEPGAQPTGPAADDVIAAVHALAAWHAAAEPEHFATAIARHCAARFAGVGHVTAEVRRNGWDRLTIGGRARDRDLVAEGTAVRMARADVDAAGERLAAGLEDMLLMTTGNAAAPGIYLLRVAAVWTYGWTELSYDTQWQQVRRALTEAYAEREHLAGAHLADALCRAVLDESPAVRSASVRLETARQQPVDMTAFGMENSGEVFAGQSAPVVHEAEVRREELAG